MNEAHSEVFAALSDRLKEDLDIVTNEQRKSAAAALQKHPSMFELLVAVKRWASALTAVCRDYAGRFAELHAEWGVYDPVAETVGSLALVLCNYLRLPGESVFAEHWPKRNFVQQAAKRLGVSADYLYRHSREFPFTHRMGKRLLFSTLGIEKYIKHKNALPSIHLRA